MLFSFFSELIDGYLVNGFYEVKFCVQFINSVAIVPAQCDKKHKQENSRIEIMKRESKKYGVSENRTVVSQI
jgi:hypothetical protein